MQGRRAGRRWAQQGPLTTSAEQAPQVANRGRSPPLPGRSALLLSYWGARACGELGGYRASPQWGAITTTAGLLLRAPLLRNGTSILQAAQDETPLLDPSIQSISKSCLSTNPVNSLKFSSVQFSCSVSRVRLFATPGIAVRQASLSITDSRSSLRLTSIESVMPSSHLILSRPLLLLPPIPPSIRVFSNESALRIR